MQHSDITSESDGEAPAPSLPPPKKPVPLPIYRLMRMRQEDRALYQRTHRKRQAEWEAYQKTAGPDMKTPKRAPPMKRSSEKRGKADSKTCTNGSRVKGRKVEATVTVAHFAHNITAFTSRIESKQHTAVPRPMPRLVPPTPIMPPSMPSPFMPMIKSNHKIVSNLNQATAAVAPQKSERIDPPPGWKPPVRPPT